MHPESMTSILPKPNKLMMRPTITNGSLAGSMPLWMPCQINKTHANVRGSITITAIAYLSLLFMSNAIQILDTTSVTITTMMV